MRWLAAHHRVGAAVGLGEERAEAVADGVAEHQRAGEERHADEHGGEHADQAPLAAPQVVEGHVVSCQLSEGLHALEHAVGGGSGHQVDDVAVGEEHDLVGVARRVRVVGDHHDGLAERVDCVAHEAEDVGARRASRGCRWVRRRR